MSSSLLLQQCPACLVRLTCIVFVMGGRWPYSRCSLGVAARICSVLLAAFLCTADVLILLYGCTIWTLTKRLEKKLDGNYTIFTRSKISKPIFKQFSLA